MEDNSNKGDKQIDWEDVLHFLQQKRKLVNKFELSFNRRKEELDVN